MLSILARAVEPIYRAAVASRNRAFDAGRRVARLPVPVISVGNISLGGTGKTPMVMRIVEWLLDAGRRPAVAMRGYGSTARRPADEHALYLERFPDLPIVAQPDRLAGLRPLIDADRIDCAVLDDGFQHRFIARDLDLVLIDATRSPFADRCLPAGTLREPVESLRRAHAIILTHCESASPSHISHLRSQVSSLTSPIAHPSPSSLHPLILESRHVWTAVPPLQGRPVIALCAIGNPDAFLSMIRHHGGAVAHAVIRRDHHRWTSSDVNTARRLAAGLDSPIVLTTDKDWVKLRALDLTGLEIARPRLALDFGPHEAQARALITTGATGRLAAATAP